MAGDLNTRRHGLSCREQRNCGVMIAAYQLRRLHERAILVMTQVLRHTAGHIGENLSSEVISPKMTRHLLETLRFKVPQETSDKRSIGSGRSPYCVADANHALGGPATSENRFSGRHCVTMLAATRTCKNAKSLSRGRLPA